MPSNSATSGLELRLNKRARGTLRKSPYLYADLR